MAESDKIRADFKQRRGKSKHQKMKAFLVLDYLLRKTDEQHHATLLDIVTYLDELHIEAEKSSVKDDIDEINYVLYMLENDTTTDGVDEDIESHEYDESEMVIQCVKNGREKEYYISKRRNEVTEDDARILAEVIYSARFLSKKNALRLIKIISGLVNDHAASKIKHDVPLLDRPRTSNANVYSSVSTINEAMRQGTKASPHVPEKITFKYQKYSIDDIEKTVEQHGGATYKVSPYLLLLNDENYYLRAFDDRSQEMRTYRVDRMKNVSLTNGEPRDGEEFFDESEIENFPQRVFGMFMGKRERVTLLFTMNLLDAAIERLGRKGLEYSKIDDNHFVISPEVEVSDHFFAWLCRFGTKVKILSPDSVAADFKKYLEGISAMY